MSDKQLPRILVVDDDALTRELLLLLLTREGYVVETAESGEAALEALHSQHTLWPDVVLTDLQMPGIRGNELARELRQASGGTTQIIAISANTPGNDDVDDFDGFLLKPFTTEALGTALAAEPRPLPTETVGRNLPVLDQTVYSRLSESMRPEIVAQLYTLCLSDVRKRLTTMREAAERGDDAAYRREAHAIKGGCGMVGASELQTLAASMEDGGIPTNYVATLDEILLACDRLQRMLIARETVPDHSLTAEVARRSHA